MLASAGPQPSGSQWIHEVKWDGMRALAEVRHGRLRVFSRTGRDVTVAFPELAGLVDRLSDALLDGEIITVVDGVPSFEALAERMHVTDRHRAQDYSRTMPVIAMAFDLLRLDGRDLTARTWQDRRSELDALDLDGSGWSCSPVYQDGPTLLEATRAQGLEGTVSKRRTATYQAGRRSRDWIKTLNRKQQSCLVGGWRQQTGTSARTVGSLLVGIPGPDGLRFAGRVGSGLTRSTEHRLRELLEPLERADSPFDTEVPPVDAAGTVWVEPRVVVEVRHLLITSAGRMRQPVFRGIRPDLEPEGVRLES